MLSEYHMEHSTVLHTCAERHARMYTYMYVRVREAYKIQREIRIYIDQRI